MALIVRDLGLLFIMAPHTGCTAIGEVLRERFAAEFVPAEDILGPDGLVRIPRKHTQLSQLLEEGLITREERSKLVVVAGVRNPFDEQVSHYKHRDRTFKARRDDPETRKKLVGDRPIDPKEHAPVDFETWLRRRYVARPWHRMLGRAPHRPPDWAAGADVIIRHERLQADVDDLFRRLGVAEHVEIPVVNPTAIRKKKPYQSFYTPRARQIVEQVFEDRLVRYGYRFEPLDQASVPG